MNLDIFKSFFSSLLLGFAMVWNALWVHPWVGCVFLGILALSLFGSLIGRRRAWR